MAKRRPDVRLVRSPETLHRLQTRLIGPKNLGQWDCLCAAQLLQMLCLAIYCHYLPLDKKPKQTNLSDRGSGFSPFVLKCLLFIALGILWRLLQITESHTVLPSISQFLSIAALFVFSQRRPFSQGKILYFLVFSLICPTSVQQ